MRGPAIGVDLRVLVRGTRTGIEGYTVEVLGAMLALPDSPAFIGFYNGWRRTAPPQALVASPKLAVREWAIPNRILSFASVAFGAPRLDRLMGSVGCVWSPHFLAAAVSSNIRRVVTFHDLSFERYPEFFTRSRRLWHWSQQPRRQARRAQRLIAVSHSTKADLVNLYGVPAERVAVVHSGVADRFRPLSADDPTVERLRERVGLREPYVLSLGTIEPRKNVVGIIRAFGALTARAPDTFRDLSLVIAGAPGWCTRDVFAAARVSPAADRIRFLGFVPDEFLPALYSRAALFVYPSFFEGFGFQPLEATACGVPTIVSNNSSLPEVVGDAAVMVDPWRPDELVDAMEAVLTDRMLALRLRERGFARARQFSWERAARETLAVLLGDT